MRKLAAVIPLTLGLVAPARMEGPNVLAAFKGGIGVQPVLNVVGPANADGTFSSVSRNVVRGVTPAGPWRISELKAEIDANGRIRVRGQGLLLAAGNRIGSNGTQRVFATLICEETAPFVERSSAFTGVALEANGDFEIDDVLDSVPSQCASPVLLIRSASNSTWFAAGIPDRGNK